MATPLERLNQMMGTGGDAPPAAPSAAANGVAPAEGARRRLVAAATGLAIAAIAPPVALALLAGSGLLSWPPSLAFGVVALLVVTPPAAAFAGGREGLRQFAVLIGQSRDAESTVLRVIASALLLGSSPPAAAAGRAGMRKIATLVGQSREAELAVLRILAAALLFGAALAIAATMPRLDAADGLFVVVVALLVGWVLLLCVMRWPVAPKLRRSASTALDIALFSALLHFGAGGFAGFYPFYLLLIFYIGLRFGPPALFDAALLAMLGFSAVILLTDIFRQEPALAIGLLLALAVLPGCFAGTLHALGVARVKAARAEAARQSTLQLISETLRRPEAAGRGGDGAVSPLSDIVDLAALEAGTFAPPRESFELRTLIKRGLVAAQATASEKGIALRWRIDARLPYRLRGQAQALTRILVGLADHAVEVTPVRSVCLTFAAGGVDGHQLRLLLRVDGLGPHRDPGLAADDVPLSLRLVERLVALLGGTFAIDRQARERIRLTIALPLDVEEAPAAPALDLAGRSVLIATDDADLARALSEPLAAWNADPSWPEDIATALNDLSRLWQSKRRVLIVDGRDSLLSALSLSHNAARLGADAPFIILIAEDGQLAGLGDVDQGEIAGFVPAPVSPVLLANAIDALPLEWEPAPRPAQPAVLPAARRAPPVIAPPARPAPAAPPILPEERPPEPAAALDPRAVDGLRALGGDPAFIVELIDTFRADAGRLMERIDEAAATGNAVGFAQSVLALRRAASPLGGTQLCDLLGSLQGVSAGELRQHGTIHVQRLDGELERLTAALAELLPAGGTRQR